MSEHAQKVAKELEIQVWQVQAIEKLLEEDATIPFIARYRKEATGSLDEVVIAAVRDRLAEWADIEKRRISMIESLKERELLTDELEKALNSAETLVKLEDIYLPYRPKRRTRASIARERGLEPLAHILLEQDLTKTAEEEAKKFIVTEGEHQVPDIASALAGARDIIAENISEDARIRENLRSLFENESTISSQVVKDKEEEGAKFRDYFSWEELAKNSPSHRILALFRGENEGILRLKIQPNEEKCLNILKSLFLKKKCSCAEQVQTALEDSYARLLLPSLSNELQNNLKKKADKEAIRVFADNLRQLLLAPPLGSQVILAIDPGFRTGCKMVALGNEGQLLEYITINPHAGSAEEEKKAAKTVLDYIAKYSPKVIAIGNGTAGRETETFVKSLGIGTIPALLVSESGASVYSASEVARLEFPHLDLTYRGAVSIGRRLIDPLAELVKIDPKAIGVGQYQHDVQQSLLKQSLDDVVLSAVNAVGVDINTASEQLLSYVSGLGPSLAKNIVAYRHENGAFTERKQILKVTRLGKKAYEQAAGFLRIRGGKNPLDASAVHPESYSLVEQMAKDIICKVKDLMEQPSLRAKIDLKKYVTETVGLPTLTDIVKEFEKPGRDPRGDFKIFSFSPNLQKLEDVEKGMRIPGIVTNVTQFGAFVDIGVHQDGLVHISQLANTFVKDPHEFVKVAQEVMVTVLDIDLSRKRLALSMKD